MKNETLDIFKENFIIKISFVFILFFPLLLLLGSAILNTSIVIMNILFLTHIYKEKKFKVFNNDIFYLLIIFWAILIINTLLNDNLKDNYSRGFGFIRFILLIFSFSYFLSYKNFQYKKIIFNFWTIVFIIVSIDLIFEFIFGFNTLGFKSEYVGRLAGFMGDELKIGYWYFCFSLIIIAANFKNDNRLYFIIFSVIMVSFLIGERANFLRLFLALGILLIILKKFPIKSIGLLIISISLILFIDLKSNNYEVGNGTIKQRFFGEFLGLIVKYDSFKELNNNNSYTPMFLNAYNIFKENKVLGVGLGSYAKKSHEKFRKTQRIDGYLILPNTNPHQNHLEILATLGLSGYLFLLFFFLYFFKKSIMLYSKNKNIINLTSFLFVFVLYLPILPTGSFFTTYGATIFWLNFSLMNLGNFKNINY